MPITPKYSAEAIRAAVACQIATAVPAVVTLAQYDIESSCGKRMPIGSNNPFGIKAKSGKPFVTAKTWEVEKGIDVRVDQNFAKYMSLSDAFIAHAGILQGKLYKPAMDAWKKGNLDGGITAMAKYYATDPNYAAKIIGVIASDNLESLVAMHMTDAETGALQQKAAPAIIPAPAPKPVSAPIKEGDFMESILSSLFGHYGTTVSSIATVAKYVPEVANGIVSAIPDGISFEQAVATFIKDMSAGKFGSIETDIAGIVSAFEKLCSDFGVTHTAVPNGAKKLVEVPALGTLEKAS